MKSIAYPKVGWMKERFQVTTLNKDLLEFDCYMQAGAKVQQHMYKESEELFIILEGEVTFLIDGKELMVKAGDQVTIPKMTMHGLSNKTDSTIKMKVTFKPDSDQGKFFEVLHFLARKNPDDKNALFKALYISRQMGYKEFSTVQGGLKIMESMMFGIFNLIAPIFGWNDLLYTYRNTRISYRCCHF